MKRIVSFRLRAFVRVLYASEHFYGADGFTDYLFVPMKEEQNMWQFYRRRFIHILPPFFIFMILYSTLPILWGQIDGATSVKGYIANIHELPCLVHLKDPASMWKIESYIEGCCPDSSFSLPNGSFVQQSSQNALRKLGYYGEICD